MEGYGTGGDRGHPRRERQTSVMLSEERVHQVVRLTILSAPLCNVRLLGLRVLRVRASFF